MRNRRYKYDRQKILAEMKEHGFEWCYERYPSYIVKPIASVHGLMPEWWSRSHLKWKPEWNALIGTMPDARLAAKLGIASHTVAHHRTRLGLPPSPRIWQQRGHAWKPEYDKLLGTMHDADLARQIGFSRSYIALKRIAAKIPAFVKTTKYAMEKRHERAAALPDEALRLWSIREILGAFPGVEAPDVRRERAKRGISANLAKGPRGDTRGAALLDAAIAGMCVALPGSITYEEMAKRLGISRERVRQIYPRVMNAIEEAKRRLDDEERESGQAAAGADSGKEENGASAQEVDQSTLPVEVRRPG